MEFLHPKCGGWVGACAMKAQDCEFFRGRRSAISRGRAAVTAWHLERQVGTPICSTVGVAAFSFCLGWLCCFCWLLFPTVVYVD